MAFFGKRSMDSQNIKKALLTTGVLWTLSGCASVGVRNSEQSAAAPKLPKQILVADFDASKGVFRVNRSGDELVAFQQKTTNALADYLVADLSKSIVPAARQNDSRYRRMDAWLVTGDFVRVNEGSRALRGLVGLGAGGTKLETSVRVYDLSHLTKEPVLQLKRREGVTRNQARFWVGHLELCPMRSGTRA